MSLIKISDLTFGYEGGRENVFENISFQWDTEWKLGLVGRNGKGKTTILRLLAGEYPYFGKIFSDREFEYFPYSVPDPQKDVVSVANVWLPGCPEWRLRREFSAIGLDEDIFYRTFSTLSKGEQTKVLLAILFLKENAYPLIDEPTNHLDAESRSLVCRYLKQKDGFLLVSHDRAFLDGCVDHICSLNRTTISIQKGNFSSWFGNKQRQDDFEAAENERLKKSIKKLDAAARQASVWSDKTEKSKGARNSGLRPDRGYVGHRSAKMMKRAKSIEKRKIAAAEEKSGLLKDIETAEILKISPLRFYSQQLLEVRDLSVSYGERPVFQPLSFAVEQGERVALCGKNGCGKSTVLKLLLGEKIPYSGRIVMPDLRISYLPQDVSFLRGSLSDYLIRSSVDPTLFFSILHKLDFSRSDFEKRLEQLSDGQRKKVLIALSLCQSAHLYLWDEPLNYIDVFSRIQIEKLLSDFPPTMIFVEHDRTFIERTATKIVKF